MADEKHQAHAGDCPDQHQGEFSNPEVIHREWQSDGDSQEQEVPERLVSMDKEAEIGVVTGLEHDPHGLDLLVPNLGQNAGWPDDQDQQQYGIGHDLAEPGGDIAGSERLDHADDKAAKKRAGKRA